jgi:hypothetical protein
MMARYLITSVYPETSYGWAFTSKKTVLPKSGTLPDGVVFTVGGQVFVGGHTTGGGQIGGSGHRHPTLRHTEQRSSTSTIRKLFLMEFAIIQTIIIVILYVPFPMVFRFGLS